MQHCDCRILDGDVVYCSPEHALDDALAALNGAKETFYRSYWRHGLPPSGLRPKSKPLPALPSYRPPVPPKSPRRASRIPKPPTPPRPSARSPPATPPRPRRYTPSPALFYSSPDLDHPPSRFSATTACTTPDLSDSRFSASSASSTSEIDPSSTPASPTLHAIKTPTPLLPPFSLDAPSGLLPPFELPPTPRPPTRKPSQKHFHRQASVFLPRTPRTSTATARERVYDELRKHSVFRAYFDEEPEPPVPVLPKHLARKGPPTPPKRTGPPTPPKSAPPVPSKTRPLPRIPTDDPASLPSDDSYRASLASYSGWPDPAPLAFLDVDPYPEGMPRVQKVKARRSVAGARVEREREVCCEGWGLEGLHLEWADAV